MTPFRSVLGSRHVLYLLGTSLLGRLPTAMAALSIVQLVRLQGGGYDLAGTMTAAYVVAGAIGQPALGRWIDRAGQTAVLVISGVTGSAAFVGMAVFSQSAPVVAVCCAAVAGLFTPPLEPALRSLWPALVPGGAPLKAAFSLDAGAQELMFIAGPLLTVLGITAFGATGNVFFAAILGLTGTLAFAANRMSRTATVHAAPTTGHVSPMRSGAFRRVVVFQFAIGVPIGILTIAATSAGEARGIPEFAGWALAANAVGALIGATYSALRPARRPPEKLLTPFALLLAVSYLPVAAMGLPSGAALPFGAVPIVVLLVFAVIAGVMLPPTLTQVFDWVHKTSHPTAMTEANAWVVSAFNVGLAAGTTGSGIIVGLAGNAIMPVVVIAGSIVTAALSLSALRLRADVPAHVPALEPTS